MLKDSHDFYDLVLNFYRARNHLVSSEQDIQCLQEANEKYTSLVWTTLTKSVTAQVVMNTVGANICTLEYSLN